MAALAAVAVFTLAALAAPLALSGSAGPKSVKAAYALASDASDSSWQVDVSIQVGGPVVVAGQTLKLDGDPDFGPVEGCGGVDVQPPNELSYGNSPGKARGVFYFGLSCSDQFRIHYKLEDSGGKIDLYSAVPKAGSNWARCYLDDVASKSVHCDAEIGSGYKTSSRFHIVPNQ